MDECRWLRKRCVVELANLLLVDGSPLEGLAVIADPERNFALIVKDGRVVKQID
ncbi:MAG: hypothetical protein NVV60_01185 [Luteimonas sp.]|nr:hypothetical protein [Luteimonas sp.]